MVQNKVEAAYARSDLFGRRQRLMDDWEACLAGKRGRDGKPGSLRTEVQPEFARLRSGSAFHRPPRTDESDTLTASRRSISSVAAPTTLPPSEAQISGQINITPAVNRAPRAIVGTGVRK